jgi:hypothetical protein
LLFVLYRDTSPVLGAQLFHTHALIRANTMATRTTKFKAAAAHAAPVFMNKAATIRKTVDLIEQAGAEDIKLLVFPETFIPGYPVSYRGRPWRLIQR